MGGCQSKVNLSNDPTEDEIDRKENGKQQKKKRNGGGERLEKKRKKNAKLKNPNPPSLPKKQDQNQPTVDPVTEIIVRMQDQLAKDSQTFILNQLIQVFQFFGNYEREMSDAPGQNRKHENEEARKIEKHCKNVILPDILFEAVDRRVKFRFRHGLKKNEPMPLHTQTLYIVHDTIQITYPGEPVIYSQVTEAPIYKMEINYPHVQEGKSHTHLGYFRLKCIERIHKQSDNQTLRLNSPTVNANYPIASTSGMNSTKVPNMGSKNNVYGGTDADDDDDDNDEEDDDEELPIIKSKIRDSILILSSKNKPKNVINNEEITTLFGNTHLIQNNQISPAFLLSNTSTSSPSPVSSEYDYAYILNTRKPLHIIELDAADTDNPMKPMSTIILPEMCITNIAIPSIDTDLTIEDEDDDNMDGDEEQRYLKHLLQRQEQQQQFEIKQYLNSKGFLEYFKKIFQETLAKDLSIANEELSIAGATIYGSTWEIIPAIECQWPKEEALEWTNRFRDMHVMTGGSHQQLYWRWPTVAMVNKVIELNCHLIPLGYIPEIGFNTNRELEWKIVFPEATRYLESCLSSAQTKIYLITKTLIKTFVEPNLSKNNVNMFSTEHLRHHLFWQCEKNFWSEDSLGDALTKFLNALSLMLGNKKLPDYFLPKRNLLQNIPPKTLVDIQRAIDRIVERPVMHLMIALKNLQIQPNLFPKFKYQKLYNIIVVDDPIRLVTNPKYRVKFQGKLLNPNNDNNDDNISSNKVSAPDTSKRPGGLFNKRKDNHSIQPREHTRSTPRASEAASSIYNDIDNQADDDDDDLDDHDNAMGAISYFNKKERLDKTKRKRTKNVRFREMEKKLQKEAEEEKLSKRLSVESFDIKIQVAPHTEHLSRILIFEIFINHFIEMTKALHSLKSYNQAFSYLTQTKHLCKLLSMDSVDVSEFESNINQLNELVINDRNRESTASKPKLPIRESMLEPKNHSRDRIKPIRTRTDFDPYTNIDVIQQQQQFSPTTTTPPPLPPPVTTTTRTTSFAFSPINFDFDQDALIGSFKTAAAAATTPLSPTSSLNTPILLPMNGIRKSSIKNCKQLIVEQALVHSSPLPTSPSTTSSSSSSTSQKPPSSLKKNIEKIQNNSPKSPGARKSLKFSNENTNNSPKFQKYSPQSIKQQNGITRKQSIGEIITTVNGHDVHNFDEIHSLDDDGNSSDATASIELYSQSSKIVNNINNISNNNQLVQGKTEKINLNGQLSGDSEIEDGSSTKF